MCLLISLFVNKLLLMYEINNLFRDRVINFPHFASTSTASFICILNAEKEMQDRLLAVLAG